MFRKKVARTRSNYLKNRADEVGLVAGLKPIANATHPSSTLSPQLMLQRKCSVNVNHLHSAPSQEHTSSNLEQFKSYFPVHTANLDQKLCPVRFSGKPTDSKLLDMSMSGVRSAERSMEFNLLHSYHSDPSVSQSMSVRSAERSIELNVLHSCHSDSPACQSMSVRSPERSIEPNELQNSELSIIKTSKQVTNFSPAMSDVRPAERSIELNQLFIYHCHPSASNLHPAGLFQGSTDLKQKGNFDLSISDVRSAERSLVLIPN
ncbi:hypothetical protein ACET3Z_012059 [Daucus carota]